MFKITALILVVVLMTFIGTHANIIGIDFASDSIKVAIVQPGTPMEIGKCTRYAEFIPFIGSKAHLVHFYRYNFLQFTTSSPSARPLHALPSTVVSACLGLTRMPSWAASRS